MMLYGVVVIELLDLSFEVVWFSVWLMYWGVGWMVDLFD